MYYFKCIILMLLCIGLLGGCANRSAADSKSELSDQAEAEQSAGADDINELEKETLDLALRYQTLYQGMDKGTALNAVIPDDNVKLIIEQIGEYGCTATGYQQNMVNYQQFEEFLLQALEGQEGYATYYYVRSDGGFFYRKFHSVDKCLFVNTASLSWNDAGDPVVAYTNQYTIEQWEYTAKGYFIYENENDRYPYILQRVKPLGERERELCNLYIYPIGYQGNNLFLTDWDQDSMDQINYNDLYEYLYYMDTGTIFDHGGISSIPAAQFESLITRYFDVTGEFLQQTASYYSDRNEYFWILYSISMKYTILHPAPLPEVVDSRENEDGTITMVVDAVYDDIGVDRAFTHEVTVRVNDDGSFKYLSNEIRPEDKENVPTYDSRAFYYFDES